MAERDDELKPLVDAWREYRAALPPEPPPPRQWASLDSLIGTGRPSKSRAGWWWTAGLVAAAACLAIAVLTLPKTEREGYTDQLLSRAVEPQASSTVSFRFRGEKIIRPAVLTTDDGANSRLGALFVQAHYSWREPLSPRSFQSWRRTLTRKTDRVSTRACAGERCFDVRTETPEGTLASVTLTLQSADLRPTSGRFAFRGEDPVDSEIVAPPPVASTIPRPHEVPAPGMEAPATPEDTLRVLAALNSIGADAGEPVDVVVDPDHRRVRVVASALPAPRRQQLRDVLAPLPRVVLDVRPAVSSTPERSPGSEAATSKIPAAMQSLFEERLGGPVRTQEITDEVLENSSLLLARAHSWQRLGRLFPPDVEAGLSPEGRHTLERLRRSHVTAAGTLLDRIRGGLRPLLSGGEADVSSDWVALVGETDRNLNQLLAGSYTGAQGRTLLERVSGRLNRLSALLSLQQQEGR